MKGTAKKGGSLIEQALKDSELRYRRLFESAQDGILILDAETGMIEDVNPYLITMLGYSREEFIKKKLWEVGAFKDIQASRVAFEALQKKEYIRYEDLPLKTKDGRLIQVEFVSNVYLVGGEKVIQCNIRDISEHKRIIAALEENEKKYHDLVNQSPDGIFIIESSGNILTVNKAMCRELEFSEEELLSMNIWDIIPNQYLDQYRKRLTKILEGQSLLDEVAEYEVRGKDGKIHYVEVLSAPHYSGKDVIGFQGIARDITARKRAEDALRLSEEKYRLLVEEINDGFYVTNEAGIFTFANSALARMYGVESPQALVGRKFSDFVAPGMPVELDQAYRSAMQTGSAPEVINGQILRPDGTRTFIEVKPVMIFKGGQMVGSHGVVRDVTERKRAEEALQEEKVRTQQYLDIASVMFLVLAADRTVILINKKGCEILGYAEQEIVGRSWFDFLPQDEKDRAGATFDQLMAGEIESVEYFENPVLTKSGQERLVAWHNSVLTDEAGRIISVVSSGEDITERKRAEEALRNSEIKLRSLFAAMLDVIIVYDADGRYLEIAPTNPTNLYRPPDDMLGKTVTELFPPDQASFFLDHIRQTIKSGQLTDAEI